MNDIAREWLIVLTNFAIIIIGVKVILAVGEIKNKVDTMWKYFEGHMIIIEKRNDDK